ncbi:MAG: hypothetical protein K2X91_00890 [Thermoleophilia bacterium]|nr:hypothetical protein [Thermoleophilia bacterium]
MRSLIRKALAAVAIASGLVLGAAAAPAFAAPVVTAAAAAQAEGVTFTLPPVLIVSAIATVVLPILVGLVTNSSWSSRAKGILHLALSGVSGILAELLDYLTNGGTFDIGISILSAGVTFGIGVGVYLGLMKPAGSSGTSIASSLANTGGITLRR